MALEYPAQAEVGAADEAQRLHQLQRRRPAAAERGEHPRPGQPVQSVGGEGAVAVEIHGRCLDRGHEVAQSGQARHRRRFEVCGVEGHAHHRGPRLMVPPVSQNGPDGL